MDEGIGAYGQVGQLAVGDPVGILLSQTFISLPFVKACVPLSFRV